MTLRAAVKGWSLWNQMALQCQPLHLWYCLTTINYIQLQQIWCPQCQMCHPIHDISFSSMSRITYFIPNTSNKSISIMLACFNQIEGQLHTHTCTCGRSPAAKHTQSWNVMNVIINLGPPRLHRFTGCPTQVKFFGKAALIQLWKDLSEQWTNQKPVLDMLVLMVKNGKSTCHYSISILMVCHGNWEFFLITLFCLWLLSSLYTINIHIYILFLLSVLLLLSSINIIIIYYYLLLF
jgi:hypothetical protein